jgi:hypothetical protein
MSMRSIGGKRVIRLEYITLIIAFVAQSIACASNTQPPEATGKQSESQVVGDGASAPSTGAIVRPNQAVQFPRSVAMQQAGGHVTSVAHQGFMAVPDGLKGSAK